MLDTTAWILSTFLGLLSVVNVFLLAFAFYNGAHLNVFHRNFIILQLQVFASFILISIGCFVYVITIFYSLEIKMQGTFYIVTQIVLLYGTCSLRPVSLAFVLERTFATIKSKNYEKKAYWWHVVMLIVFVQIISFILIMAIYQWRLNTIIFIAITLVLDLTSLVSIFILRYWNRKLFLTNLKSYAQLTHRYQITENIRAMNAIFPLLLGIISFNLLSMSYSLISVPTGFLQKYIALIFYGIMNFSVLVCIIIALVTVDIYREKVLYRLPFIGKIMRKDEVMPNKVTNFEGKKIITVMNDANYFNMLKNAWK